MLWDSSPNGGFSVARPWVPGHGDYMANINAAVQVKDSNSAYWYWAKVIRLRKEYPEVFIYRSFALVSTEHMSLLTLAPPLRHPVRSGH